MKLQLKVKDKKEMYSSWLKMTSFIHKLQNRHQDVLVEFLMERDSLMKQTNNNEVLVRELLFSVTTKKKICERINVQTSTFTNTIMPAFRKSGVIVKVENMYDIHNKIIPNFTDNSVTFKFKIIDE